MNPTDSSGNSSTKRVSKIREELQEELQFHQIEAARIKKALDHLGVTRSSLPKRAIALKDYLVAHPNEVVTTKAIKENPAKYGIITTSGKL